MHRLLAALLLTIASIARAQDMPAYIGGEESAALEALRLAEIEMFRRETLTDIPRLGIRVPPGASSELPAPRETPTGDVAPWLDGLRLPDLPVRWRDQVVRYLDYFRHDPRGRELMGAWIRRSTRYGAMLAEELRAAGMPEDLRCVAMAESGFDPTIRSSRGALGMWQFVSGTATEYGLRQDRWVDERMDPVKSTRAAARMLGDLHRRFGTWELALAAYNMGYGALLRAIRKYNTNDYWVLADLEAGLPFETTVYVAKIMACAVVMRNPERFELESLTREPPIEVETFEVPGGVGLARIARAAHIEPDALAALNPELRRSRTPPGDASWDIKIPRGSAETFARAWSRIERDNPAHRPYVVRFGETLALVAERFRTSERDLREVNGIENGERIGAGTTVLVPAVDPRDPPAPRSEELPLVAVPDRDFQYSDRRRVFYRTSASDTLPEIARHFHVEQDELRRWNHLDASARLQDGMVIQIYAPRSLDLSRVVTLDPSRVRLVNVGTEAFFDAHEQTQGRVRIRYRVAEGDTLSGVANRFGLSVGSLTRINRFSRRHELQIGEELVVYCEPERLSSALRRELVASAEPAPAPSAGAAVTEPIAPDDEPTDPETRVEEPTEPETGDEPEPEAGDEPATDEASGPPAEPVEERGEAAGDAPPTDPA